MPHNVSLILLLLTVLRLWVFPGRVEAQQITAHWQDAPLPGVLAELAARGRLDLLFEAPQLQSVRISVSVKDLPAADVLDLIARRYNLALRHLPGGTIIVTRKPPPPVRRFRLTGQVYAGTPDRPAARAELFLEGRPEPVLTDSSGWFQIQDIPRGTYGLAVRHALCEDTVFTLTVPATAPLTIALRPLPVRRVVTARPPPVFPARAARNLNLPFEPVDAVPGIRADRSVVPGPLVGLPATGGTLPGLWADEMPTYAREIALRLSREPADRFDPASGVAMLERLDGSLRIITPLDSLQHIEETAQLRDGTFSVRLAHQADRLKTGAVVRSTLPGFLQGPGATAWQRVWQQEAARTTTGGRFPSYFRQEQAAGFHAEYALDPSKILFGSLIADINRNRFDHTEVADETTRFTGAAAGIRIEDDGPRLQRAGISVVSAGYNGDLAATDGMSPAYREVRLFYRAETPVAEQVRGFMNLQVFRQEAGAAHASLVHGQSRVQTAIRDGRTVEGGLSMVGFNGRLRLDPDVRFNWASVSGLNLYASAARRRPLSGISGQGTARLFSVLSGPGQPFIPLTPALFASSRTEWRAGASMISGRWDLESHFWLADRRQTRVAAPSTAGFQVLAGRSAGLWTFKAGVLYNPVTGRPAASAFTNLHAEVSAAIRADFSRAAVQVSFQQQQIQYRTAQAGTSTLSNRQVQIAATAPFHVFETRAEAGVYFRNLLNRVQLPLFEADGSTAHPVSVPRTATFSLSVFF